MDIISEYTREQAIEDGVLVDVTEWASSKSGFSGGFNVPVCVTSDLWGAIEAIPKAAEGIQDVRGRAHDVLFMAAGAMRGMIRRNIEDAYYTVILPFQGTRKRNHQLRISFRGHEGVTIGFPSDF